MAEEAASSNARTSYTDEELLLVEACRDLGITDLSRGPMGDLMYGKFKPSRHLYLQNFTTGVLCQALHDDEKEPAVAVPVELKGNRERHNAGSFRCNRNWAKYKRGTIFVLHQVYPKKGVPTFFVVPREELLAAHKGKARLMHIDLSG
ncbi:hypothetical protein WJX73_008594 [Symbiochloris irregularis]|uniref:Uncharacterized protein n=1 Tax=Symbiochloris irregularis TaxID=706552 RepID=A0AAW1P484_9CHLO